MASVITNAIKYYGEVMEKTDPRVEGYFMMSHLWPNVVLTLLYVYVVQWAGPRYMENRKPFEIKRIMLVYNFAMILLSGYIFMEFALAGWFAGYSLKCQPVDYSSSPQALRMVRACWLFYFSKYIEMLDTVFFILRKKNNQVTFLHVFHHGIMPLSWWIGAKFVAGGFGTFHALLNSFIHFMMYTYYFMAALGPAWQKYLWWKKYMTKMQITQFFLVMVHTGQLYFIECDYPILFANWIFSYAAIFFVMFADFYRKAYNAGKAKAKSKLEGETVKNGAVANGVKKED